MSTHTVQTVKDGPDYIVRNNGADHPMGWKTPPINDLRSALDYLKSFDDGEVYETNHEIDSSAQLAGGLSPHRCRRDGTAAASGRSGDDFQLH